MKPKLLSVENGSFLASLFFLLLIPVFFVPGWNVSFEYGKSAFFYTVVFLGLVFYLAALFRKKSFPLLSGFFLYSSAALLIVYILSAFLAPSSWVSVIGYGFETLTLSALFFLLILCFLVANEFQNIERLIIAQAVFVGSGLLVAIFHISRFLFGDKFLSFFGLNDFAFTLLGTWTELGIFFGAVAIVVVAALETLPLRGLFRFFAHIALAISILFLIIINSNLIWYTLGAVGLILSCVFFAHRSSLEHSERRVPKFAIGLFILALFFILPISVDQISSKLNDSLGINFLEVRPSWAGTFDIGKNSFAVSPFFGPGPNRFSTEWELYRPNINSTEYWNTSFGVGVGWLPTTAIETGILGLFAWLVFLGAIFWLSIRLLLKKGDNGRLHNPLLFASSSSALVTLYLWTINVFYTPNLTLIALTFFFTGLAVALYIKTGILHKKEIFFAKIPHLMSFVFAGFILVALIAGSTCFLILKKSYAAGEFKQASEIFVSSGGSSDSTKVAIEKIVWAIKIDPSDLNYRQLAELKFVELNNIVAQVANGMVVSDDVRANFERSLRVALEASQMAQNRDPKNYTNWLSLARIHVLMSRVEIPDSVDVARSLYKEAVSRSPHNPAIYLEMANLEADQKNYPAAREFIDKSLGLKSNYVAAIFLLSQIDVAEGKISSALKVSEEVTRLAPGDPTAFLRLGLLNYEQKNYQAAIRAFERAVTILPSYANAEYFLGLSYHFVGRNGEAIARFENLSKTNPENSEVKIILANLKADRAPFADVLPPLDDEPEKRDEPPLDEIGE